MAADDAQPQQRVCEQPGCRLCGEYRAPRARDRLTDYRWFCLEHIREYNKKWDYFAGLGADHDLPGADPRELRGLGSAEGLD